MKKIKLMKNIKLISHSNTLVEISDNTNSETIIEDELEDESETVSDSKILKRPPIGVLPAYIPID